MLLDVFLGSLGHQIFNLTLYKQSEEQSKRCWGVSPSPTTSQIKVDNLLFSVLFWG